MIDQALGVGRDCCIAANPGSDRCGSPILAEVTEQTDSLRNGRMNVGCGHVWKPLVCLSSLERSPCFQDIYRAKGGASVLLEAGTLPCPWVVSPAELGWFCFPVHMLLALES